jgi:hypothetical protein
MSADRGATRPAKPPTQERRSHLLDEARAQGVERPGSSSSGALGRQAAPVGFTVLSAAVVIRDARAATSVKVGGGFVLKFG